MKYFLTILFFVVAVNTIAQNKVITKYYDSLWMPVSKENASFYAEFEKLDTTYRFSTFYYPSKKLYSTAFCEDTLFSNVRGTFVTHYENGNKKDSTFYDNSEIKHPLYTFYKSGALKDSTIFGDKVYKYNKYLFQENGKILAHTYYDDVTNKIISNGYDEQGKIIPNYIYEKTTEFPGGINGWVRYLQRNLRADIPVQNGAPAGRYTVVVRFIVGKDGRVSNVIAENNPGYGTMEEAIRVIRDGPDWEPAIEKNQKVVCRHRQSITFAISENK